MQLLRDLVDEHVREISEIKMLINSQKQQISLMSSKLKLLEPVLETATLVTHEGRHITIDDYTQSLNQNLDLSAFDLPHHSYEYPKYKQPTLKIETRLPPFLDMLTAYHTKYLLRKEVEEIKVIQQLKNIFLEPPAMLDD